MTRIEQLMRANLLGVFGERDAERRRAAIAETYAPDVTFADPESTTTGTDALDAKAQSLLDGAPDFVFAPDGPVRVAGDLGYLAWGFGPQEGPPAVQGLDIALVVDGRIAKLWTFVLSD